VALTTHLDLEPRTRMVEIYIYSPPVSRPVSGTNKPYPIVTGDLPKGIKRPKRSANTHLDLLPNTNQNRSEMVAGVGPNEALPYYIQ
jgi:hypothetical protein